MRRLVPLLAALAPIAAAPAAAGPAPAADSAPAPADDPALPPDPAPAPRHPLRAAIEEALFLATGVTWYWIDRERQVADWDYPSVKQRLTFEAWRFDNNPFGINFGWHAFDGAIFHAIARSNGFGLAGAFGYGFASSMVWELLLEFREKVSINDVIVTPGGGVVIGEFLHWLGRYLSSGERGAAHEVARWSLGGLHAFHGAVDRRDLTLVGERDALGLTRDIAHRFTLTYGIARADVDGSIGDAPDHRGLVRHELRASGELAALPGYLRPGRLDRGFLDGNLSTLDLRATLGDGRPGLDALADVVLLGRHVQELDADGAGRAVTYGLDLGYRYRRADLPGFRDRLGLMHLPGLALDVHLRGRRLGARARIRANLDFVGIEAAAHEAWRAANPDATEKTILRKQGYYYGWGGSTRLALELTAPHVALGGTLLLGAYRSIEGLDKSQEQVTDDVAATDVVREADIWLEVAPTAGPLVVELRASHAGRDGELGGFGAERSLRRVALSIGARL